MVFPTRAEKIAKEAIRHNISTRQELMNLIVPAELNLFDEYEENTQLDFLGGGGNSEYYIKYLKYKTKYLKLKKNL